MFPVTGGSEVTRALVSECADKIGLDAGFSVHIDIFPPYMGPGTFAISVITSNGPRKVIELMKRIKDMANDDGARPGNLIVINGIELDEVIEKFGVVVGARQIVELMLGHELRHWDGEQHGTAKMLEHDHEEAEALLRREPVDFAVEKYIRAGHRRMHNVPALPSLADLFGRGNV